jgi:hypothetical protein
MAETKVLSIQERERVKTPPSEEKQKKKERQEWLTPDNPAAKRIAYIIIAILTTIVTTIVVQRFIGINNLSELTRNVWYRTTLGAVVVILLVDWYYKKNQLKAAATLCKWVVLPLAVIMLFVNSLWPGTTLKGLKVKWEQHKAAQAQAAAARQRPVKVWQTVWGPKTYVGVGYTGGNDGDNDGGILTVKFGKDYCFGDKSIISGKRFDVWCSNGWKTFTNKRIQINKCSGCTRFLTIRAAKGVKVTVEIQRLMEVD